MVWRGISYKEVAYPLLFCIITGITIPQLDNVYYYFLLDKCGLTITEYEYLNMSSSIGIVVCITFYIAFLRDTEVRKLVFAALCFLELQSMLLYANVCRWNIDYLGIPDFYFNIFIFFFSLATIFAFIMLPLSALLMHLIPKNIEASMFAVIVAILNFATDWAGQIIGGVYCNFFGVTTDDLS